MNRDESQGGLIALASAASWLVLLGLSLVVRPRVDSAPGVLHKLLRFTTTAASQSLVQLSLFFSGPFYLDALVWSPAQSCFALVFVVACAVSLWDPLCTRVLHHPLLGPLLVAFSSFVAWNAALPMLAMPQRKAVMVAALAVA